MTRALLIVLFCAAFVRAEGPLFRNKDTHIQQEFENSYKDIRNVLKGNVRISTLTVSSATFTNLIASSVTVRNTITASSATIGLATISSATIADLTYTSLHPTPTGKFIQIVSSVTTTSFSTTSNSYQATPLGVSITPSAATSKVLCIANIMCLTNRIDLDACLATITNNGNNLGAANGFAFFSSGIASAVNFQTGYALVFLDSPNTTSAIAYRIAIKTSVSGTTITFNNNATTSSMVCAEIGA